MDRMYIYKDVQHTPWPASRARRARAGAPPCARAPLSPHYSSPGLGAYTPPATSGHQYRLYMVYV